MKILSERRLAVLIILFLAIGVMAKTYTRNDHFIPAGADSQDMFAMDRRITSLEQRLYSIETSISRLQQSIVSQRPVPESRPPDREVVLMRSEIQTLQLRLNEIECGLVKLDERTRVPGVREDRASEQQELTIHVV